MQEVYLALYGDKIDLMQAMFISIFAMAIVFLVLLIISYLIDAVAFFLNKKTKPKNNLINIVENNNEVNIDNISDDNTVVIIAAAIAAYLGTKVDNIRIKKIRRVTKADSAWTERGLISYIR